MSNISEIEPFSEEIHPVVDEHLINQLKALGFYDQFLAKQPSDNPDFHLTGFYNFSSFPQVDLIETNDFEDILNDLPNRTQSLDLVQEQQNDEVIREVVLLKNCGNPDKSQKLTVSITKVSKAV